MVAGLTLPSAHANLVAINGGGSSVKHFAALTLAAAMGCVHSIPLAPVEQCAVQSMTLNGITMSSGTSSGIAFGNGGYAVGRGVSYGQSVSCRPAQTTVEQCVIAAAQRSAAMKYGWDPTWRNLLIGVGYLAFILPGVVLDIAFFTGRSETQDDAIDTYNQAIQLCAPATQVETNRPAGWQTN